MSANGSRASRFRTSSQHTLELPSGNEVIARRVGLLALVQRGVLPDTLTPLVSQMISRSSRNNGVAPTAAADLLADVPPLEQARLTGQLWDTTLQAISIDPQFVEQVTDPETQVALADVGDDDKRFLFDWANGQVDDLAQFRQQRLGTVPVAPEGEDVRDTALPAAGAGPGPEAPGVLRARQRNVAVGDLGGRDAGPAGPKEQPAKVPTDPTAGRDPGQEATAQAAAVS